MDISLHYKLIISSACSNNKKSINAINFSRQDLHYPQNKRDKANNGGGRREREGKLRAASLPVLNNWVFIQPNSSKIDISCDLLDNHLCILELVSPQIKGNQILLQ